MVLIVIKFLLLSLYIDLAICIVEYHIILDNKHLVKHIDSAKSKTLRN